MEAKERAEAKAVEADLQRNGGVEVFERCYRDEGSDIVDLQGKLEKANIDLKCATQELNMSLVKHQQRDVAEQLGAKALQWLAKVSKRPRAKATRLLKMLRYKNLRAKLWIC